MQSSGLEILKEGQYFNRRYCICKSIKAGSMGAVYEVFDAATRTRRALKVMNPSLVSDPEMRGRFELEAKVTGSIQSDHIVHVSDAGVDEATGIPFLVMDLLRGEELGALLRRRGGLRYEEVVLYLSQAAFALNKTHRAGIVHRDLKPENMFITRRDDGSPCLKILDFGLAKVMEASSQAYATRAMGTPIYMAPEQGRTDVEISPAADLYALGQIAYSLLVGEAYWAEHSGSVHKLLVLIFEGIKEPATQRALRRKRAPLPAAFDGWFFQATAQEPKDRFQSAIEAVDALAEVLSVPGLSPRASVAGPASTRDAGQSQRGLGYASTLPVGAPDVDAEGEARTRVAEPSPQPERAPTVPAPTLQITMRTYDELPGTAASQPTTTPRTSADPASAPLSRLSPRRALPASLLASLATMLIALIAFVLFTRGTITVNPPASRGLASAESALQNVKTTAQAASSAAALPAPSAIAPALNPTPTPTAPPPAPTRPPKAPQVGPQFRL